MNKHDSNHKREDMCNNCKDTNSEQYWDYEDGSMLCEKCHNKIGDAWYEKVKKKLSKEHESKTDSLSSGQKKSGFKLFIVGAAILIVVLILGFSLRTMFVGTGPDYTAGSTQDQGNVLGTAGGNSGTNTGTVQNAKLALVDFSYELTPNQIKVGVPVRIEVDASTLAGCMKTVVIKDFGVRKSITAKDNIIEFTPTKTGTFWITCSMGMGPGSFEVVNADGTSDPSAKATLQNSPPSSGGSCGSGGGGCGCGGG